MTEDCGASTGCGCGCGSQVDSLHTDKECPACGRLLRVSGNMQRIKLRLACPNCGYCGPELSLEEVREYID